MKKELINLSNRKKKKKIKCEKNSGVIEERSK